VRERFVKVDEGVLRHCGECVVRGFRKKRSTVSTMYDFPAEDGPFTAPDTGRFNTRLVRSK